MEVLTQLLPYIAVIAVLTVLGTMVYIGLREDEGRDPLSDRLRQYGDSEMDVESLEEVELSLSLKDRVFIPVVKKLADFVVKFTPQRQIEFARRQMELAGSTSDPGTFFIQRIVFTILLGFGGAAVAFLVLNEEMPNALLYVLGGMALGYYFPVMSLNSKIRKRQEQIVRALPDALDLLVICVEAGLGLEQAMGKVYEKWDNELALAFGRVIREIQLGKFRRDALRDMARRMDVPDVNSFVAAIIQAEQLGVSMAKILRVQSDQMRVKRRQRAQEKAQKAPVKMMIPMVLIIFPSIWIVLLGPAVLQLMDAGGL